MLLALLFSASVSCTADSAELEGDAQEENQDGDDNDSQEPDTSIYADAWNAFDKDALDNVLIDFSYAGYERGEKSVPDVESLGYKTFDITDYGAIADDDISDRAAFEAAAAAIKSNGSGILYIPEGTFDIHNESDDSAGASTSIFVSCSNFILKGADREKSILRMQAPMLPTDESILYSSPVALNIKHMNTGSLVTSIDGNSVKGSSSVWVESTTGLAVDQWICLKLEDNTKELVEQRLGDHFESLYNWSNNIISTGIQVWEYHQIKSLASNKITFYEPIMHEVNSQWDWGIYTYPYYEGVGIEDLTFQGFAKDDFVHHASWEDDGAYKPLTMMRLVNSWMRRVNFQDVSEAASVINCANVSVYDIIIDGNVGHSAIRSQYSTRTFLGKITDRTGNGTGQFHSVGVSKPSIGAVIWRTEWGNDSCFESHATQPRATLIDACYGAFIQSHAGGDLVQNPNHMEDLTIWNFEASNTNSWSESSPFTWWIDGGYWQFLYPIVVGFHGADIKFDTSQMLYEESTGESVYPESLYEAQLERRLGSVPQWLQDLKAINH